MSQRRPSRRTFLTGAAIAGAALGIPTVVKAQGPSAVRWQSAWPQRDIFHEHALDFAKKVNDMTGGDLKIEVLPAGAVVPAFGLLDAVSKGTLDGGHGTLVYHYAKQAALAVWGSGPSYGMDANMLLAWHRYGGGKQLLSRLYESIGANVVFFRTARWRRSPSAGSRRSSRSRTTSRVSSSAPSASRSISFRAWAPWSARCPPRRSCRPSTAVRWTPPSSITRPLTASSASPTCPRSACCRATTRTQSSSRSCSTRRGSTRCLTR